MSNLIGLELIFGINGLIPWVIEVLVGHVEIVASLLEITIIVPSSECLRCTVLNRLLLRNASLSTFLVVTHSSPIALSIGVWTLLLCLVTHYGIGFLQRHLPMWVFAQYCCSRQHGRVETLRGNAWRWGFLLRGSGYHSWEFCYVLQTLQYGGEWGTDRVEFYFGVLGWTFSTLGRLGQGRLQHADEGIYCTVLNRVKECMPVWTMIFILIECRGECCYLHLHCWI